MSLSWIIDDIIIKLSINAEHKEKIKFRNNLFSKIKDSNVLMYKRSIQEYLRERATHYII